MSFYGLVGQGPLVYAPDVGGGVYIAGDQGLHRRDPASGIWSLVASPAAMGFGLETPNYICSPVGLGQVLTVVAGDGAQIAQTRDSGATWDPIPNPSAIGVGDEEFVWIQHGADADTLYLAQGFAFDGSDSILWKTTNAGVAWTKIIGPYTALDTQEGLGVYWFAVTTSRIWYTAQRDPTGAFLVNENVHYANLDGSTQVHLNIPRDGTVTGNYITAVRGDDLQAYTWERTISGVTAPSVIYRVDGSTLTDITPAGFVPTNNIQYGTMLGNTEGVVLTNVHIVGAPNVRRLLRSTDFGASWSTVLGPDATTVRGSGHSFPGDGYMITNNPANHDEWWACSNVDATVNYSGDGGATWSTESVPSLENTQTYMILATG